MKTKILCMAMLLASSMLLASCGSVDNPIEEIVSGGSAAAAVAENSLQIDNNTIVSQAEAE